MNDDETNESSSDGGSQRIDKWLWAARFYKTRSLAAQAVSGGKVHVDSQRIKPAKLIKPGQSLRIRKDLVEFEVVVLGLSKQRRPATEAMLLYQETKESQEARAVNAERRRERGDDRLRGTGRPTKRDRRQLTELKGGA